MTIGPWKLYKALGLRIMEARSGQYVVEEEDGPYYVRVHPAVFCACHEAVYRKSYCSHQIAALLAAGDPDTIRAVGDLYGAPLRPQKSHPEIHEPLDVAIARLIKEPDRVQLAARIITDPDADASVWQTVARSTRSITIHFALAQYRPAATEPTVRQALLEAAVPAIAIRLAPYMTPTEVTHTFRTLLQERQYLLALNVLSHCPAAADSKIQPAELLPLLQSPDDEVRKQAVMAMKFLNPTMDRSESPRKRSH